MDAVSTSRVSCIETDTETNIISFSFTPNELMCCDDLLSDKATHSDIDDEDSLDAYSFCSNADSEVSEIINVCGQDVSKIISKVCGMFLFPKEEDVETEDLDEVEAAVTQEKSSLSANSTKSEDNKIPSSSTSTPKISEEDPQCAFSFNADSEVAEALVSDPERSEVTSPPAPTIESKDGVATASASSTPDISENDQQCSSFFCWNADSKVSKAPESDPGLNEVTAPTTLCIEVRPAPAASTLEISDKDSLSSLSSCSIASGVTEILLCDPDVDEMTSPPAHLTKLEESMRPVEQIEKTASLTCPSTDSGDENETGTQISAAQSKQTYEPLQAEEPKAKKTSGFSCFLRDLFTKNNDKKRSKKAPAEGQSKRPRFWMQLF